MDWSECRGVGAAEVEAIVVPRYLPELPILDGWGHPLEFCIAEDLNRPRAAVGVRSPGSDGRFEGPRYTMGGHPLTSTARDVVWIDGFFAPWPERERGAAASTAEDGAGRSDAN